MRQERNSFSKKPTMAIMSSLSNSAQCGGGALRFNSIVEIYKKLGFEITIFYMDSWNPRRTLKGEWGRFLYQSDVRILFSCEKVDLSGFQFIHFDNLRFFQWNIIRDEESILIYNAHNLEYESYYPRFEQNNKGQKRFVDYEISQLKKTDNILVCSKREKSSLIDQKIDENNIFVIPNLVDKQSYYATEPKKTILFLGSLDYLPNIRAVDFICERFYPKLPRDIKEKFDFVIAGRNPSEKIRKKIATTSITLKENLTSDKVYKLLSKSLFSLVPLDHGSGTRLKIVESLFSGAKILSTPLGAEGFENNSNISISSLENFVEKFLKLLNEEKKEIIISNEFYRNNDLYSWISFYQEDFSNFLSLKSK